MNISGTRSWSWALVAGSLVGGAAAGQPSNDAEGELDFEAGGDIADLDLESLLDTPIGSVSRKVERSSLAPASVFVVSASDIRRQGFRTLAEILSSVPGLFISDDTLYPVAGVRGLNVLGDLSTRLLVLLDGHPLNNSVGIGQSYLGRDLPVSVLSLERVEVIKGPIGSIYGATAYYGVVNLVTRQEEPEGRVVVRGDLTEGLPTSGEAAASWAARFDELRVKLDLGVFRSRGRDFTFPELALDEDRDLPPDLRVVGSDGEQAHNAYARFEYLGFSLTGGWSQRTKGLPTAPYATLIGDPLNNFYNRTGFAQLSWEGDVAEHVSVYARAAYDDFKYTDDLAYEPAPDPYRRFHDVGTDRWWTAETRLTLAGESRRAVAGVEVQGHDTLQQSHYPGIPSAIDDPVDGFGVGPIERSFLTFNGYLLAEQSLFEQLYLQGGLTFYMHGLFGSRLTPKLSAVWQATEDDVVKALYSEGFRPPTLFESVFEDRLDFLPNPALVPETAATLELAYERRIADVAQVGVSLYRTRYQQLIGSVTVDNPHDPGSDIQQFQNAGGVVTMGIDSRFNVRLGELLQMYGGLALQTLETDTGGTFARANFAPVTASLAASTRALWRPLSLALNGVFVSSRETSADASEPSVPAYVMLGASARLEVPGVEGLTFQTSVRNLLDVEAYDPVVGDHWPISRVNLPGFGVQASIGYRF